MFALFPNDPQRPGETLAMSAIESEASEPHQAPRTPDKTQLARSTARCSRSAAWRRRWPRPTRRARSAASCTSTSGRRRSRVGAIAALKPKDYVVATYREHGHAYAKGMGAKAIIAELYGKETGCSKGLGGSMHLFDAAKNFLGGYGIVGGHVPLAAGAAFASKYRGDGRVTLCFFGDGASRTARSTRASRSRRCGSCRSCSSARTTSTRWARRSTARSRSRTCR